jgi:NADPH:quinone reductase-like Zn-dependent oxidoreductase
MWGRISGNFWNAFLSNFTREKFVFYIAKLSKDDFNVLRELMEAGKVSPVIDRTYKIEQTLDAVRYMEEGHSRGKVVVVID